MHILKQSEGGTLLTLLQQYCAGFETRLLCRTAQRCSWAPVSFRKGRETCSAASIKKEKKNSVFEVERKTPGDVMDLLMSGRDAFWRHVRYMIHLLTNWMCRNTSDISKKKKRTWIKTKPKIFYTEKGFESLSYLQVLKPCLFIWKMSG